MKKLRETIRTVATGLFLAAGLLGTQSALAGGGGLSRGGGSDDADTVPLVGNPQPPAPGFILQGSLEELEEVLVGVRGRGTVSLRPTWNGLFEARFTGDLSIPVSRSLLTRGGLDLRYAGPRGTSVVRSERGGLVLLQRGPIRRR